MNTVWPYDGHHETPIGLQLREADEAAMRTARKVVDRMFKEACQNAPDERIIRIDELS